MKRVSKHSAPVALRKRGLVRATEVAPLPNFSVANAGKDIAHLFRDDLMRRLSTRQSIALKETAA